MLVRRSYKIRQVLDLYVSLLSLSEQESLERINSSGFRALS